MPKRYEPIRRIASGGMATVWCARDLTLGRNVAIKLLAKRYANDELAGRRFTREGRVAARLSGHPNVVTIFDVGRALPSDEVPGGRPFIVMAHLPGGTVADALRTGELDRRLILKWLREAASALDYAHGRGVIHRDVKLTNLLLDGARQLHVADFGIAQLGGEDTLSGTGEVVGTTAYLAPERALGLPATESSDRYALAVVAFELLVGERPFTAHHFAAQARQHLEDPPPPASRRNPALPSAIDPVLARGIAKHQDERFATAAELVDRIERALAPARRQSSPTHRQPSPTPRRVPPPAPAPAYSKHGGRRSRVAPLALAGALLCLLVTVGASLLSSGGRPAGSLTASLPRSHHSTLHAASDQQAATIQTAAPDLTVAAALEGNGHQLMLAGNYQSAIPVLRRAVAAAPHASLTYAYALYDLGHSLRLDGDPQAAVPILRHRLQIPNQTSVVRTDLTLALVALGQN